MLDPTFYSLLASSSASCLAFYRDFCFVASSNLILSSCSLDYLFISSFILASLRSFSSLSRSLSRRSSSFLCFSWESLVSSCFFWFSRSSAYFFKIVFSSASFSFLTFSSATRFSCSALNYFSIVDLSCSPSWILLLSASSLASLIYRPT